MPRTLRHRLRIGRRTVRVVLVERFARRHQCGEWAPASNAIRIRADLGNGMRIETLWHECLHAVWPRRLRRDALKRYGREEATVRLLATRSLQLLSTPSWRAVVEELLDER